MRVWILTREVNWYDQDGEYFVGVFSQKPTKDQLEHCKVPQSLLSHVLKGGGRVKIEDEWFHLREHEC